MSAHTCDIVFHDTSVSRQHARITVTNEDILFIEDLKSRNGVLISGKPLEGKRELSPSVIVTMGTTSFVIYDREGEMQTIISPLLPSIVKVLQHEEEKKEPAPASPAAEPIAPAPKVETPAPPRPPKSYAPLIFTTILIGLFTLAGLSITSLFKQEPVPVVAVQENQTELLDAALAPFPAVKYSFNKPTGSLLLLGHVQTAAERNQLLYNLQGLNFIKSIDDSSLVIDESAWREINFILAESNWKGITVHAPSAGQFVLTGYLQTRQQAQQLSDYISLNFRYLDLLKNNVIIEEDILNQINARIQQFGLRNVTVKMANNGEITFNGSVPADKMQNFNLLIADAKKIPGVRLVNNYVRSEAPELGIINLTDQYAVSGYSQIGAGTYTVVINGRILTEGDSLDGMLITRITPNMVLLEKDGTKYRIDYK